MRFIFCIFIFFSCSVFSETNAVDDRILAEKMNEASKFSLIPHQPTYLLPFNFNDKIQDYSAYKDEGSKEQQIETKYQISFKTPIFHHIGELPIEGYVAYTQVSFWQSYNTAESSPFRETNYQPEMFLRWKSTKELGNDWNFKAASFGFTHESNGRSDPISRSWNRLSTSLIFSKHNFVVAIEPWYRIPESLEDDNNPDLLDYYGHGKITLVYKYHDTVFSLISRNNLESGFSKGSTKVSLSFPVVENVRGYIQAFSGYGNSLIEYNLYTNTVGVGISLTDFL